MNSLQPSDITAIAATAIALIALVFTIRQGHRGQKHAELSVTPLLSVYYDVHKGTVELLNQGVGPARISQILSIYDNNTYDLNVISEWQNFLAHLTLRLGTSSTVGVQTFEPNCPLAAQHRTTIVQIDDAEPDKVRPIFRDLAFKIVFVDLYGNKEELNVSFSKGERAVPI